MKKSKVILVSLLSLLLMLGGISFIAVKANIKKQFNPLIFKRKTLQTREGIVKYSAEINEKTNKLCNEIKDNEEVLVTITFAKPLDENQVKLIII